MITRRIFGSLIGKRRRKACNFQHIHEHKHTHIYDNLNKAALKYRGGRNTSISTTLYTNLRKLVVHKPIIKKYRSLFEAFFSLFQNLFPQTITS